MVFMVQANPITLYPYCVAGTNTSQYLYYLSKYFGGKRGWLCAMEIDVVERETLFMGLLPQLLRCFQGSPVNLFSIRFIGLWHIAVAAADIAVMGYRYIRWDFNIIFVS